MKNDKLTDHLSNHMQSFYFSIPDFNVKVSIDVFNISIYRFSDQHFICDFFKANGFKSISNKKMDKGHYAMNWRFENPINGVAVDMIYGADVFCIPAIILRVHDPNKNIHDLLTSLLSEKRIYYTISYLEIAFDFYSDNNLTMHQFLTSTVFQKYQYIKSFWCKSTFYTSNSRKRATRAIDIYFKKGNPNFVRMELRLSNYALKRTNLRHSLNYIDSLDLTRFFRFMVLDENYLNRYLFKKSLLENGSIKHKNLYEQLIQRTIHSWIRCLGYNYATDSAPLMRKIDALKVKASNRGGIANYSRFLVPHEDFQCEFMKQVSSQKYLRD